MGTTLRQSLEGMGFVPSRFAFTLRTAITACIAIWIAWLAGLEHPQWSGMTVWAASLPIRGELLEKSLFRFIGTIIGALYGVGLLIASEGNPWLLVCGLALWIGLCAGAGNVIQGFASYGAMLAGYSALMVSLLHSAHSSNPFAVGIDRVLTVLCGAITALIAGWFFSKKSDINTPVQRTLKQTAEIITQLKSYLAGHQAPANIAEILSELAAIDETLDSRGAGSLRSRQTVKSLRHIVLALVPLLLWMKQNALPAGSRRLANTLPTAEDNPASPDYSKAILYAATCTQHPLLHDSLRSIAHALDSLTRLQEEAGNEEPAIPVHRDWIQARQAFLRSFITIMVAGATWLLTGWQAGTYLLLGSAVMTTIFSTMDNPVAMLKQVIIGQALGAFTAFACHWLVWPHADSEPMLIWMMMPFVIGGGIFMAHKRGAGPLGFDFSMVLLLMLQPVWPLHGTPADTLAAVAGVILGPILGLIAFMLIFPPNTRKRLHALIMMMTREISSIASRRGSSDKRAAWRARLSHRILYLLRFAHKTQANKAHIVETSFTVYLLGATAMHLDALLMDPTLSSSDKRNLHLLLNRLAHLSEQPDKTTHALELATTRFAHHPAVNIALIRQAATHVHRTARRLQA